MRIDELGLGWRSHLLACRHGAEVVERDDCIVLRSPANPTYYWGNCLILAEAPRDQNLAHWLSAFAAEIGRRQPESTHTAIGINAPLLVHDLPTWRAAGIDEFDDMAVLTLAADALLSQAPPRDAPHTEFRALRLPQELEIAVQAQVDSRDESQEAEGYRVFRRRAMQRVMAMSAASMADWYGVFVDGRLAASCGLVHDRCTGRFQFVETHPDWRRRGLCRTLVHGVCQHAFEKLGLTQLVMCADPHDVAIGIYRSVGFTQVETHWCLQRRPPRDLERSRA